MANSPIVLFVIGSLLVSMSHKALASDPDLTTDFGINSTDVADFTFRGLGNTWPLTGNGECDPDLTTDFGTTDFGINSTDVTGNGQFLLTSANFTVVRGLTGLGLAAAVLKFGPQGENKPHTHPRATEILFVLEGKLDVGFVDTANNLFETTVQAGDLFVFPKGLLHFQRNNYGVPAMAFAALSSENPGTLRIADALFTASGTASGTGLPDNVLSTALATSVQTIQGIKQGLSHS